MVSGIGPVGTPSAHQNSICADCLGVGQKTWEDTCSGPTYPVNVVTHNTLANPSVIGTAVDACNTDRTGILTKGGGDFLAFGKFPSGLLSPVTRKHWPDVEHLEVDAYFGDQILPPPASTIEQNYAALLPVLTAPFSRGNVTIVTNDSLAKPAHRST